MKVRFRGTAGSVAWRTITRAAAERVGDDLLENVRELWPAYLLATILILYGFQWGLPNTYSNLSFQADENAAVWATNQIHFPSFNPRWFLWGTGLFYQAYLLKLLVTAGGLLPVGYLGMLVIGRLIVFASALGAITVLFRLGSIIFDRSTARLAATILAVLPGFVIGSHYFKTDVPATFWMLATTWMAYKLIDSGKQSYVPWVGLLVGYSSSIKYSAAVMVVVGCVAVAATRVKWQKSYSFVYYLACVALGFAAGEPSVLVPGRWGAILEGVQMVRTLNRAGAPYKPARPAAALDYMLNVLPFSLTIPMLILSLAGLVWILMLKTRLPVLPILTFLTVYWCLLASDNARLVRYTIPVLPFASLFIANLAHAFRRQRYPGLLAGGVVLGAAAYAFLFSLSYVRVMAETDPRIQASRWIQGHMAKGESVPELRTHYLNLPQLGTIGYQGVVVGFNASELESQRSPYLLVSEFSTFGYLQAIDYYPQQKEYFHFLSTSYREVIHFENAQKLLFVDSKRGTKLPQDWLHPNPRITVMMRIGPSKGGEDSHDMHAR